MAYRKASRWTGWWLAICLAGVAAEIAVLVYLTSSGLIDRLGGWALIPACLPFFVAVGIAWKVLATFNRQRLAQLKQLFERKGWTMNERPSESEKSDFAAPLLHLFPTLQLLQGTARIEWFALPTPGLSALRLFEHQYVTGSGKTTQVHYHTVAAWPSGHPAVGDAGLTTAPWFLMGTYPWLTRRVLKKNSLHDPAFVDVPPRWILQGSTPTGVRFLKPHVPTELERAPEGEEWSLGAGWIVGSFKGTLDAENMERFLVHAAAILAK